jgi:5,6-dimethylbenzimidazole synthase
MATQLQRASNAATTPSFDASFRQSLAELLAWRRDVRRFLTDPVDPAAIDELLDLACLAPSVGNSQPWRFVSVESPERRAEIRANFEDCNAKALGGYAGEKAAIYAGLKLSGLAEAPVQLAVFADEETEAGAGLGRQTMPETLRYSAVLAVHTFWLAARAQGLGVGWVSILDPARVSGTLETPAGWSLVAYLCLGYPVEEHVDPELQRFGWQARDAACRRVLVR